MEMRNPYHSPWEQAQDQPGGKSFIKLIFQEKKSGQKRWIIHSENCVVPYDKALEEWKAYEDQTDIRSSIAT